MRNYAVGLLYFLCAIAHCTRMHIFGAALQSQGTTSTRTSIGTYVAVEKQEQAAAAAAAAQGQT